MEDFYSALQTDTELVNRIEVELGRLDEVCERLGARAAFSGETRDQVYRIFKTANYNCGILFPFFFPEALPPTDEIQHARPLSLFNRPFAFALTDINPQGETTIRGSRQISKSTTFIARQLILSHMIPNWSSIYIAPHMSYLKTYANRMRDMERHFRYFKNVTGFRQNLQFKEYPNSSSINMVRVDTSVSDIRSKSADEIIVDESQHFDATFMPEVEQVLRAGQMKSKLFAGTSLDFSTFLEAKYQSGSQGTWHARAMDGKNWINCGDPDEVLKIIQVDGPTCPFTNRLLNMADGQWVHGSESRFKEGFISYHVPQILIPEFVTDYNQWAPVYRQLQEYTRIGQIKKFIQEVLGIPTEEGHGEISEADLKLACCLPETPAALKERCKKGYYHMIVSGVDWGGSDWNPVDKTKQSYTFHAIVGITHDKQFDILHMEKYSAMDYQSILQMIVRNHREYNGSYLASDFSAGSIYNLEIHNVPGMDPSKHFIFGYQAPNYRLIAKAKDSMLPNHYNINKTETITQLFSMLKDKKPRIRTYAWELARPYITDILNLRRLPADIASANPYFLYRRHGSKPDDGLHAINFATFLAKMVLGEPLYDDPALKRELQRMFNFGGAGGNMTGRLGQRLSTAVSG